jgi:hypothetical protein
MAFIPISLRLASMYFSYFLLRSEKSSFCALCSLVADGRGASAYLISMIAKWDGGAFVSEGIKVTLV